MARVIITGNLKHFTEGVGELELEVATVRQLFRRLSELYPALGDHLDDGFAVAIDGQIYQDAWLQEISDDAEVALLPQIGGG